MKCITQLDLQAQWAPQTYLQWFKQNHPDGASVQELLVESTPSDFLCWISGLEILDKEAKSLVNDWVAVRDKSPFDCSDTEDSFYASKSSDVKNSQYIHSSIEVADSSSVCLSSFVQGSHQIFNSEFVFFSQQVALSQNVESSNNVVKSSAVFESSNIYESKTVLRSREIRSSNDVTDSAFCASCNKIENCLFCVDLIEKSFHIFNTPVDPARFSIIKAQYLKFLSEGLTFVKDWPKEPLRIITPQVIVRFDKHYQSLPDKFWRWARTLPGYSEDILYQITFLPQFSLLS